MFFKWLRELRDLEAEWEWCPKCEAFTRTKPRKVRYRGELMRGGVCAKCGKWRLLSK